MYLALLNYDRFFKKVFSHTLKSEDEHIKLVNRFTEGVRKDALAEGIEIGLEKGELIGAQKKTIAGIQKALKRGKLSVSEIAEDFEVTTDFVQQIKAEMK